MQLCAAVKKERDLTLILKYVKTVNLVLQHLKLLDNVKIMFKYFRIIIYHDLYFPLHNNCINIFQSKSSSGESTVCPFILSSYEKVQEMPFLCSKCHDI